VKGKSLIDASRYAPMKPVRLALSPYRDVTLPNVSSPGQVSKLLRRRQAGLLRRREIA